MKRLLMMGAVLAVVLAAGCAWYKSEVLRGRKEKEAVTCTDYYLDFTINRPVAEVFDRLSYWDTIAAAAPRARFDYVSKEKISGTGDFAGGQVGSGMVSNLPWRMTVADWEPGSKMTFVMSETQRGFINFDLAPDGERTRVKVKVHFFFLPDSSWGRAFEKVMKQGQLEPVMDRFVTDIFMQAKARLEGVDPGSVKPDSPAVYEVFEDSYFMVERDFAASPKKMFKLLSTPETLAGLLPLARIEAADSGAAAVVEPGVHYHGYSAPELGPEVVYDLVVLQFDPGKEMRFYLAAHGVQMDWEIYITPTLTGSRVQVLFMVNLPAATSADTLNVIIQTNSIDRYAEEGLARLAEGM